MINCGTISLSVIGVSMIMGAASPRMPDVVPKRLVAGIAVCILTLAALNMAAEICQSGAPYVAGKRGLRERMIDAVRRGDMDEIRRIRQEQ